MGVLSLIRLNERRCGDAVLQARLKCFFAISLQEFICFFPPIGWRAHSSASPVQSCQLYPPNRENGPARVSAAVLVTPPPCVFSHSAFYLQQR